MSDKEAKIAADNEAKIVSDNETKIIPVIDAVQPYYNFPDEPAVPIKKTSGEPSGIFFVWCLVGAILLANLTAYGYQHGYIPSLPELKWEGRKVERKPSTPAVTVDERARLFEAMSEYIVTTRQLAFERSKPSSTNVAALVKRSDELKIEIRALALRQPANSLPPEAQRFLQGM